MIRRSRAGHDLPVQHAPLQLHEVRPDAFAMPAFEAGLAEMPAHGQFFG